MCEHDVVETLLLVGVAGEPGRVGCPEVAFHFLPEFGFYHAVVGGSGLWYVVCNHCLVLTVNQVLDSISIRCSIKVPTENGRQIPIHTCTRIDHLCKLHILPFRHPVQMSHNTLNRTFRWQMFQDSICSAISSIKLPFLASLQWWKKRDERV